MTTISVDQETLSTEEFYVVYNAQGAPFGRTVTMQEADMICARNPLYQWDIKKGTKKNNKYHTLPLITIHDAY